MFLEIVYIADRLLPTVLSIKIGRGTMLDVGGTAAVLALLFCVSTSQTLNVNAAAEDPSRNVASQGDTVLRYVPQPSVSGGSNDVINHVSNISLLGDDYENDGDTSEVDVSICDT